MSIDDFRREGFGFLNAFHIEQDVGSDIFRRFGNIKCLVEPLHSSAGKFENRERNSILCLLRPRRELTRPRRIGQQHQQHETKDRFQCSNFHDGGTVDEQLLMMSNNVQQHAQSKSHIHVVNQRAFSILDSQAGRATQVPIQHLRQPSILTLGKQLVPSGKMEHFSSLMKSLSSCCLPSIFSQFPSFSDISCCFRLVGIGAYL